MRPVFSGWVKRLSAGLGGRFKSAAARCEWFGGKLSPGGDKNSAVRRTAALAAEAHSCRRGQLPRSVCGGGVSGGLGRLWVRSAGFALAFVVFASALLGPAPVWSQSLSTPVVTFAATTDTVVEGEDDVGLRIGLPSQLIGQRVVLQIIAEGTAVRGTDYRLIAADPAQDIVIGDGIGMALTLEVPVAPAEELRLLLRPRSDDRISQGDRNLSLTITGVTAAAGTGESLALPAALRFSIRDDEPAPTVAVRIVTFVATTDTVVEGEDDVGLRIGLPSQLIGQRVVLQIIAEGTAVRGTDYRLIAAAPAQNIVISYGTTATLTLEVPVAPAEDLRLLLRPRSDDRISQGDRNLSLTITGVTAAAGTGESPVLPAALRFSIRDDEPAPTVAVRIVKIVWGGAIGCVERSDASIRCWDRRSQFFNSSQGKPFSASDFATVRSARDVAFSPLRGGSCWLLADGEVRCDDSSLLASYDLSSAVHVESSLSNGCAAETAGRVLCWGLGYPTSNRFDGTWGNHVVLSGQGSVAQLALADFHGCALLSNGRVRCWEFSRCDLSSRTNDCPQASPPNDLERVTQLAVGASHNCVLTAVGGVRCWGYDFHGQSSPPEELGPVAQISVGVEHSCALTESGQVRCWGLNNRGQATPPEGLGPVAQLVSDGNGSCALQTNGQLRCWGDLAAAVPTLPSGGVAAIAAQANGLSNRNGYCALLTDGSIQCWGSRQAGTAPLDLRPGDVTMSVVPQQLQPGQRGAIFFTDLRDTPEAFDVRIEVSGEGLQAGVHYQLLDRFGKPVTAEADGSYILSGDPQPMAWLEALEGAADPPLYLDVRPLGVLPASAPHPLPTIRSVAQRVELTTAEIAAPELLFTASADTVTEGAEEAQLSILLPLSHTGLRVELELAVSGTAVEGSDYTLEAADPEQGIVLGGEANSTITLRVESAPTEPLRLLLQFRADDRISQGYRLLNLRISRYRVVPEGGGTVDLPPALDFTIVDDEPPVVQQMAVATGNREFACFLLSDGSVRCWGRYGFDSRSSPPLDLGRVAQIGVGEYHSCALTVSGRVRCWGRDGFGESTPPGDLGPVAQIGVGGEHSCALTVSGGVRCWGRNGYGQSSPPADLGRVAQISVGRFHSCVVTVSGEVRCWGRNGYGQSSPPDDLAPVAQIAVGLFYTCALTVSGGVRCWGDNRFGQSTPPEDLGRVAQIGVGGFHSCALTVSGGVRCWGDDRGGQSSPPDDLGPVAQLAVGRNHSCALTVSGQLRCWGSAIYVSSLPAGLVTAVSEPFGACALLAEGSVYCPSDLELVPPGLGAGVVMSVWPRQLLPGQRAAIRFTNLRYTAGAFTARIEVFGEGTAEIGSYYRLLGSNGQSLLAEEDGSYRFEGNPPMAWLEASGANRSSRLYVRPLQLLSTSGSTPSIRVVAQPVELIDGLFFSASTDTLSEGTEEAQLSIWLPLAHAGLQVELELAVIGTAVEGSDYTLEAADPEQGIVLGGEANSTITLRVESAPAEPLLLRLRSRGDDRISQGARFLNLRISSYRVVPEGEGNVDLPPALDFTIRDDDPQVVQQVLGNGGGNVICARLNEGLVRCSWGDNFHNIPYIWRPRDLGPVAQLALGSKQSCALTVAGQVRCWDSLYYGTAGRPPEDTGPIAQLSVGDEHSCALTVAGRVRCWGDEQYGRATPPDDLGPVAQLMVGARHSCAVTVSGRVRCWGWDYYGQSSPPEDLGLVVQIGVSVSSSHNCAVTVAGGVRCWGNDGNGRSSPPDDLDPVAQLALGNSHNCAVTVAGGVRCWGNDRYGESTPPEDLGPVAQLGVSYTHSCALTVSGRVRCWGDNRQGLSTPPEDLGVVAQISVGDSHSCALTVAGRVRCWGNDRYGQATPPEDLGLVVQIGVSGAHSCALTVSDQVYCWGRRVSGEGASLPPADLGRVVQIGVGGDHGCALTVAGGVRCWGDDEYGQPTPPEDLGPVAQIGVGEDYSCALQTNGRVRCWGRNDDGQSAPPDDLGPVAQLAVGSYHSCALQTNGRVRCWGSPLFGKTTPPDNLGPIVQLSVGIRHSCALQTDGQLRCWGDSIAVPSLPSGAVTAIAASGACALLAEGSVYCPGHPEFVPPGLGAGEVVMWVEPRQLQPGQRAAIRFTDLRDTTGAFTARIEVFGEGDAEIGSYYRLLNRNGQPLPAEPDGSYRLVGAAADPPMAWLEASGANRSSLLYVRPLELLSASGPTPSIRVVAQPVELIDGLFFSASTDTVTEGAEEAQLSIWLPLAHAGLQVELELAVIGTAVAGSDYTLEAADPEQRIVLGGEANSTITLRVESAPTPTEPLRLLLRTRVDDRLSQGDRFLTLRISRYRVSPGSEGNVDLPPALDLTIVDDEPPVVQQVQVGGNRDFACVLLNDGSVRCWGSNTDGRSTPPADLGPVAQLSVGNLHSCARTVSGQVRCWGRNVEGQSSPPGNLGPVAQISVGYEHSCALTVSGEVRCWGRNLEGQSTPPGGLGNAATQIGAGFNHSCALTVSGGVRCWGRSESPPDDLGPVAQISVGPFHSCALTVSGEVRCWPEGYPSTTPPEGLDQVVQISVGFDHSCALTVSGQLRCWGDVVDVSSLPPGMVMAIDQGGLCALLAEGSVYCPDNPELVPPELHPGDVVMSVWPRQLEPGQRAAIRFADLRETTGAFTARIEVFGEGDADIGNYYRLLNRNGQPLRAEQDGSYRLVGAAADPPMAWLEASGANRSSRLYVRPLELLSASDPAPSIRVVAQPIKLIDGVFFSASTDTVTEGTDEAQLSIWLPLAHAGLQVELELAVIGTAVAGSDYTLEAADPEQRIVLGGEANSTITLRVESAPTPTEPLRLLLRTRVDDRLSQGDRFLNLRISRYRVSPEGEGTVDLPPALDFTIVDDEQPTVQQVLVSPSNEFSCVHLNGGSVRCAGANDRGQISPPEDLGSVAQLGVGWSTVVR